MEKVSLGISTCLLGENVRYDGRNVLDCFLRDTLGKYVRYVPVCPEVECGFGVPRETMRLMGDPAHPRLVTACSGIDYTKRMEAWAGTRATELEHSGLCGFIFKSNSPSCGLERVKVYDDKGEPRTIGAGIFARIFREQFPPHPGRGGQPAPRPGPVGGLHRPHLPSQRHRARIDRKRAAAPPSCMSRKREKVLTMEQDPVTNGCFWWKRSKKQWPRR